MDALQITSNECHMTYVLPAYLADLTTEIRSEVPRAELAASRTKRSFVVTSSPPFLFETLRAEHPLSKSV
jgi:hypothetical protein